MNNSPAAIAHAPTAATVDFDLHGLVGIRLVNPSAADVAAVAGQLGPLQARLTRTPDIVIEFVDQLPLSTPLRYLGVDDTGFTDDAFLVLTSRHHRARVQIPLEHVGEQCRIRCEAGVPAVPLLIPIINLTALARGCLPLHAAAFVYQGQGVLVTGWSKGGKTEALLAFMAEGARYVGDEWVYLDPAGEQMCGIPEPIRVWDWHLRHVPRYRAVLKRAERGRLAALKLAQDLDRLAARPAGRALGGGRLARKLRAVVAQQRYVDVPPARLFGADRLQSSSALDQVFFVGSHAQPEVCLDRVSPETVAQRMVFSLEYERLRFASYYLAFRFAFPHLANPWMEQAETLQRERLLQILRDRPVYTVYHPYPVPLADLFTAMRPCL